MRKKSHILLARYLADQMEVEASLQKHRKAFCFGSILPDIKPSFLTTKHEYFGTFEAIQHKMQQLIECDPIECKERVYWRRFGEVMHYMADYFTFPHNKTYTGTLLQHGQYEKKLKNSLKSYIRSGNAMENMPEPIQFADFSELTDYIRSNHEHYLEKKRSVNEDIQFILKIGFQVCQGIIQLGVRYLEQKANYLPQGHWLISNEAYVTIRSNI